MKIESLVPEHKSDIAAARAAIEADFPTVAPVLPELTAWLKDFNWPVAKILAPFLASIGKPMIPQIDIVFASNDPEWKYWIISTVIGNNAFLAAHYQEELKRLATQATNDEKNHELDQVAQESLQKLQSEKRKA